MGTPVTVIALPIFGILTMAFLLDVKLSELSRGRLLCAALLIAAVFLLNVWVFTTFGRPVYRTFYFFWVQFPLCILFFIISQYRGIKLLFVLLTAIAMASLPTIATLSVSTLVTKSRPVTDLTFILSVLVLLTLIYFFIKPDFNYMLQHGENRIFWGFCIIPVLYYIYSFSISGYNFSLDYMSRGFLLRRIPDVIVLASYYLLIRIFHDSREKQLLNDEKTILSAKLEASGQYLLEQKTIQEQALVYRHDMRHHISLLAGFATEGDLGKIKAYLARMDAGMGAITPIRYCENETVNLIATSYAAKAKKVGVVLCTEVNLPEELAVNDTELCSLLSNALDNAVNAAALVKEEALRTVNLRAMIKNGQLLISVENTYTGVTEMSGGLPKAPRPETGHGFGARSIAAIVERHGGLYSFQGENGVFLVQLALPLGTAGINSASAAPQNALAGQL